MSPESIATMLVHDRAGNPKSDPQEFVGSMYNHVHNVLVSAGAGKL
jgi:hypothetical protein